MIGDKTHVVRPTQARAETFKPDPTRQGSAALTPAARRALAEAQDRKTAAESEVQKREIAGRGGLDPVRYGDWEIKGLTSDF